MPIPNFKSIWQWEIAAIRQAKTTDNVVELMTNKIAKLAPRCREALQSAACIGNRFDLQTLAIVQKTTPQAMLGELWESLQEGLILPLDDRYKFSGLWEKADVPFRFLHDRVQQAAYSLMEENDRNTLHLNIGRLLLQNVNEEEKEKHLFEIVTHLNFGLELIAEPKKKEELAELNLRAGKKAKVSNAFKAALNYLKTGMGLLGADAWKKKYDMTLELFLEAAETCYLDGNFAIMDKLTQEIIEKAKTPLDKVKAYEIIIKSKGTKDEPMEAVKAGAEALQILGVNFPTNPGLFRLLSEIIKIKFKLPKKNYDDILNLPVMTDPLKLAEIRILSSLFLTSYATLSKVTPYVIVKMVNLSLTWGNNKYVSYAYVMFGILYQKMFGNIGFAYRIGNIALQLADRLASTEFKPRTFSLYNFFIQHWTSHLRKTLRPLEQAYLTSLETGDLETASFTAFKLFNINYSAGITLSEVRQKGRELAPNLSKINQCITYYSFIMGQQVVSNLTGENEHVLVLKGAFYDEEKMLPIHYETNNIPTLIHYFSHKLILSYLFYDFKQALAIAKKGEITKKTLGEYSIPLFYFYDSLGHLAVFFDVAPSEQRKMLKRVQANQKKMKKWAHYAPMNFLHKYDLVEAELARVKGKKEKAMDAYDKAIAGAKENEYLQEEALANDVAARFYLSIGKEHIAAIYLKEARYLYEKWGATAKVRHLEETYPLIFSRMAKTTVRRTDIASSITPSLEHTSIQDFKALVKALKLISGEIVLEDLLKALMKISLEKAGAERGFLILEKNDELGIEAEGKNSPLEVLLPESRSMSEGETLATSMVRYVFRTGETVLLDDAREENRFSSDRYISTHTPRSILCAPIQQQNKIAAVVYLENNLATHAFTADRLETLTLLSSHAAISIENARLYKAAQAALKTEQSAREDLQRINRLKDEFLATTSHELQTPLHGIIGLTKALKDRTKKQLASQDIVDISLVIQSSRRLSRLVKNVLDFSRMKYDDLELQKKPVELWNTVDMILNLSRYLAKNKDLSLINLVPADFPSVWADEERLPQILQNLVGNAVKFTQSGSVTVTASVNGDMARICVSDTGIGIPLDRIDVIFDSFEQGNELIKKQYGGMGLGLAIAKNLVEKHEGKIWVESTPGKGAEFYFTLPFSKQQADIEESSQSNTTRGFPSPSVEQDLIHPDFSNPESEIEEVVPANSQYKILVVDDDPVNLQVVKRQLSSLNQPISTLSDGVTALENIQKGNKPDLILLDVMMPKISGFDLCQELRKTYSATALPIIFLTARNQLSDIVEGFSAGGNDYLVKPFSQEELLARVQNQLNQLQSGKKLVALRQFADRIGKMQDVEQILREAFEQITANTLLSFAVLFKGKKMLVSHTPEETTESREKAPSEKILRQLFPKTNELVILNKTNNPLQEFYQSNANQNEFEDGYWCAIRLHEMEEYVLLLYRKNSSGIFDSADEEFFKSVVNGIKNVRKNLREIAGNEKMMRIIAAIRLQLDNILYIQVKSPYCYVVLETPEDNISYRITLENLQTYFSDETLMKVHKSYLVNPHKEYQMKKKGTRDWQLQMQDRAGKPHEIPVGRRYTDKIKQSLSD